jgi:pimeloyl-ACP methyl ester carboxylesterase
VKWDEWRSNASSIKCGGLSVATYDLGAGPDAPSFTYLHGYPSSSLDIAPAMPLLAEQWRVLALDMPGFGASAKPHGHPFTIHAATDAVEAMWADRRVESTVVVAHDYSVSVAQELLARRSENALDVDINAILWMNGGLYPDLHRPTIGQQLLSDPLSGAEVAAAITEPTFIVGMNGTWGERVPPDESAAHEMFLSMDDHGGIQMMNELLHYMADRRAFAARWRRSLEECDLPSTFVWGDLDPVSGAHMIARVEERIPGAEVVRLADVGHWPCLEAPDVLAAHIDALRPSAG